MAEEKGSGFYVRNQNHNRASPRQSEPSLLGIPVGLWSCFPTYLPPLRTCHFHPLKLQVFFLSYTHPVPSRVLCISRVLSKCLLDRIKLKHSTTSHGAAQQNPHTAVRDPSRYILVIHWLISPVFLPTAHQWTEDR